MSSQGIDPPRQGRLLTAVRGGASLPAQVSSFVGRGQVMAGLRLLLERDAPGARLVTLTGTGGTGKTRVALQLASHLLDSFPDGAFFVALAAIVDPALVVPTIADALGLAGAEHRPPLERLIDYLATRRALLVLDNFEQVLDAAPAVSQLLAACPELRILVTSRAPLRVSGEQEYVVPPMTLLAAGAAPASAEIGDNEAVRLFVERARSVRADFALTDQNAGAVAEICRRLDGLPLAIELAAAHARLMDPPALLARLASPSGGLDLLVDGGRDAPLRQRTLRATIEWSHDLLDRREQVVFRRLAVFVGGCTLPAAEAVCSDAHPGPGGAVAAPVLPELESLVAKSLLRRAPGAGEPRLAMLETIREFALERLVEAGELETLRRRHADHFLCLAELAEIGMRGPDERTWLDRLEADQDNLRAALEWALAADPELAGRLAGALSWFWWMRRQSEGRHWLARALSGTPGRSRWRTKALHGAGHLAHMQQDSPAARQLLEESLALAREQDDTWTVAWVLHLLGRVAYFDGDAEGARALGEQSVAAARAVGDDWLIAWAIHLLALAAHIAADYPSARAHYERSLAIRQRLGWSTGIATVRLLLGMVAFREGDFQTARRLVIESMLAFRELGTPFHVNVAIAAAVGLAASAGRWEAAVSLAAASARLSESHEVRRIPLSDDILEEGLARARRQLDPERYAAAWARGRAMATDDAIAEAAALELARPSRSVPSPGRTTERRTASPASLTAAELRVLRLIASGSTTRQIADELVVAVSTVERHITHIYAKIGARGRAAATAFALQHGLAPEAPGRSAD